MFVVDFGLCLVFCAYFLLVVVCSVQLIAWRELVSKMTYYLLIGTLKLTN